MNFFITAGNTQSMIDQVRCVTNIFSGRTGANIARTAWGRGHSVTLATSHPEGLAELGINYRMPPERFTILPYRTFDDLAVIMQTQVRSGSYDVVCHSAAVSDYLPAGTFTPNAGTFFNARTGEWESPTGPPTLTEQKAAKIKSTEPELWLRLVRAPKLVDRIRQPWSFTGILVKFKLEVGISEQELLEVAEASRVQSDADLIVANTLDGAAHWAYLGPLAGRYERIPRRELPDRLIVTVEDRYQELVRHG
ncbi:MAG: phosphopantothenoylcysteine decarboxylase [Gemmataceae bacterium]|nr:bifunctional phosphopantothenoylcysteine decarboxylase/phosphopantothenate synthase [Gemmata sp.]MDW8196715.1 phosphopantothenoylcysteine decarboxylase [Gemmataceae bacterium]